MKTKEFTRIGKQLLPHLSGFVIEKDLIFKSPIGDFLYAINFHGSDRNKTRFYTYVFVLPLYVPTEVIHFNYGERLMNAKSQWDADDPYLIESLIETIQKEAIPFFNKISMLQGVVEYIQPMVIPNSMGYINPHSQEALAYTLLKKNDIDDALNVLNQIQETLSASTLSWELKIKDRALLLRDKLMESPETALQQLETWKTETIRNLGLEKYC
jgi:hypothetical protein